MNLLHKLALVALLATAAGLSAHSEDKQVQDIVKAFTLSAFANAYTVDQETIVTELLQNIELSDEKIAQMLEVEVTAVTHARTYFGPLEVAHLAKLAATGYKHRCYKRPLFEACALYASMAVMLPIVLGGALWFQHPDILRRALPWLADPDGLQNYNQQLLDRIKNLEAILNTPKAHKKWFWQKA